MATPERTEEILKGLYDSVLNMNKVNAVKWAELALAEGVDPVHAALEGLSKGMIEAGECYNRQEYFVPELLQCSRALYAGLDILKPAIKAAGKTVESKGTIILGVIEGDIHDIGKNLVKIMFDVSGWTIYDLGTDVPIDKFVEEHRKVHADVVGISALMTTSMLAMPETVRKLKQIDPNVIVLLGGAPITPQVAELYGADGMAPNAGVAVSEAVRLLKMRAEKAKSAA